MFLIMAGVVIAVVWLLKPKEEPVSTATMVTLKPVDNTVLKEISENMEQAPVGEIVSNKSVAVTDQITELYHQKDNFPLSICDITNMGPSPIYIGVNQWEWPEAPLPVGQSIHVDLKKKFSIKKIFLKCDAGLTSNIYLYTVR